MAGNSQLSGIAGACAGFLMDHYLLLSISILPALALGFVVYQLYFHPLAKYPGPLLGRITQLYEVYHAYIGDKHVLLYQLHQKYGTIVRFSPNTISINDPEALKAIYSRGANVRKGEFYKCFRVTPTATSTLLATEKQQHARKRRVMGLAFSDQAMKGIEQYVLHHVENLIEKLDRNVKKPMGEKGWSVSQDMQSFCNWFVFDIMGDLVSPA
jgi:cytochrome P450